MNGPNVKANVGDWYLDRDKHDFLCVIAVEDDEGVVNVRDEYGDIDEIDFDEWDSMDLVLCSAPQSWSDSVDTDFEDDREGTSYSSASLD